MFNGGLRETAGLFHVQAQAGTVDERLALILGGEVMLS